VYLEVFKVRDVAFEAIGQHDRGGERSVDRAETRPGFRRPFEGGRGCSAGWRLAGDGLTFDQVPCSFPGLTAA
jgi:hypothetical protein